MVSTPAGGLLECIPMVRCVSLVGPSLMAGALPTLPCNVVGLDGINQIALPPIGPAQTRLDAAPDLGSRLRMQDTCHADCITALLAAESAHGRMLLSASRDGVVKAWK
jgi:hypothetical protein